MDDFEKLRTFWYFYNITGLVRGTDSRRVTDFVVSPGNVNSCLLVRFSDFRGIGIQTFKESSHYKEEARTNMWDARRCKVSGLKDKNRLWVWFNIFDITCQFRFGLSEDEFEERVIRTTFEKHAANRYSDRLSTYKTSRERDVSITDDVWQAWERVWDSDEAKKKSAQARANRMSEPARPGTGPVRHTGGSMSALKHKAVLARELGREPTHAEVHKRMHTLKADPTRFMDERARIAVERFEQEMLAATQTAEGSTTSTPVDPNEVYLAVEGVRKRRIYGLGSIGSEYVASQRGTSSRRAGSSSQTVSPAADARFRTDLIAQFADTIRDQVQIAVAAAMEQMHQRAPGDVLPTPPPPPPAATDDVPDDDVTDL
ncbi:uncharacterized protein LOC126656834 [Mercurialis annua]|uniref:uncharacterized protein LOC126656834 n=1 Tax=Mercurialis annua TaxID=3986 RepID=UPI00215FDD5D|nr:uncharacterized protein LOC126656834 [Mercurialis annua]